MSDLTTAQRLAAYWCELRKEGFDEDTADAFVNSAAPTSLDDVEVQDDLDDPATSIGDVRVRMVPSLNEDDLHRVAERVRNTVGEAGQR